MEQSIAPKKEFLKSAHARFHSELVTAPAFKFALEMALLQFVSEQAPGASGDFQTPARNQMQLEGARRFIYVLLNLAEKDIQRPIRMASDNLPNET